MWSPRRTLMITATALAAGALALGTVAFASAQTEPRLPVPDPAAQAAYESELAKFLVNSPKPSPADFESSVEGQNAYWQAVGAWWESVPWDAVAGQWGCESGIQGVTFNPATEAGVITAGYGGTGDCGGFVLENPSILSVPETRTSMLEESPELLTQLGQ